jgi:4'-phosphopantetheinyl transferase
MINDKEIHIWSANLKTDEPLSHYFKHHILSKEELSRAESFKFDHHKLDFIASHGYLRMILSQYLKCPPGMIEYDVGKYGKPFLKNQSFQHKIHFNMSHSQDMAVYAVALDVAIGVDIEKIEYETNIVDLINHVFTSQEIKVFMATEDALKHQVFYEIWTRKEAILKTTGEGLNFPLTELEVLAPPNELFKIFNIGSLYSLDFIPGYAVAVASMQKKNTLHYFDVSKIILTDHPKDKCAGLAY